MVNTVVVHSGMRADEVKNDAIRLYDNGLHSSNTHVNVPLRFWKTSGMELSIHWFLRRNVSVVSVSSTRKNHTRETMGSKSQEKEWLKSVE